jgi:hypothetical protein
MPQEPINNPEFNNTNLPETNNPNLTVRTGDNNLKSVEINQIGPNAKFGQTNPSSPIPTYNPNNQIVNNNLANKSNPATGAIEPSQLEQPATPQPAPKYAPQPVAQPEYEDNYQTAEQSKAEADKKVKKAGLIALILSLVIKLVILGVILSIFMGVITSITLFTTNEACKYVEKFSFLVSADLKNFCKGYRRIEAGCYNQPTTGKTAQLSSKNIDCIGKAMDDPSDNVELYGLKNTTNVKKEIIKEIIKASKDGKEPEITTRLTIALFAIQSPTNGFKEAAAAGCYGIAQICANTNYGDATEGLTITSIYDYMKSPELQVKSIGNLYRKRIEQLKTAPDCYKSLFQGKSDNYKFFYTFDSISCDGITADMTDKTDSTQFRGLGLSKSQFANYAELNMQATDCNEFKAKLASSAYTNLAYKNRDYIQVQSLVTPNTDQIRMMARDGLLIVSEAQFQFLGQSECTELKKYKTFIEKAASKYSNNLLPLSPALIGGMLSRESNVGLANVRGKCDGYGDYGNGHGLGQADPSSGDGIPGKFSAPGIVITVNMGDWNNLPKIGPKINKQYGTEKFIWSDCEQGIMYAAAHMVGKQLKAHNTILGKIQAAGISIDGDDNGFKDPRTRKAYVQMVLNTYNAGEGGIKRASCSVNSNGEAYDGCTTGRDYGKNTLLRSIDVAKCIGGPSTIEEILSYKGGAYTTPTDTATPNPALEDICATTDGTGTGDGSTTNTGDALFPMVSTKGVIIRWTQPFPAYIPSGGAHNGIDLGPEPTNPESTKVVAMSDGTILDDFTKTSLSCTGGSCGTKVQRVLRISDNENKSRNYQYVHLDTSAAKKYQTKGATIKKGDVLGQIDNFMFVHLHFTVFINNIAVQPTDHLPILKGKAASPYGATDSNTVPIAATQKL